MFYGSPQVFFRGRAVSLFTQHDRPALFWSCSWLLPAFTELLRVWGGASCTTGRRKLLPFSAFSSFTLFLSSGGHHHWIWYPFMSNHQDQGLDLMEFPKVNFGRNYYRYILTEERDFKISYQLCFRNLTLFNRLFTWAPFSQNAIIYRCHTDSHHDKVLGKAG